MPRKRKGRKPPRRKRGLKLAESQRVHARRRAFKRFGIVLTDLVHDEIVQLIEKGVAKLVLTGPRKYGGGGECSTYELVYKERPMQVVFDTKTRQLVTFLFVDKTMYLYEMVRY